MLIIPISMKYVFFPAYDSLILDCYPNKTGNTGFIGGTFDSKTGNITIYKTQGELFCTPEILKTIKHEMTHKRQFEQHRLFDCNNKVGLFINEAESYISEYLP